MLNFGEKMLMSAEVKGCVTWFMHFLDLLWVRYNGAKFHQCKICVTDFREWRPFWFPPHPWAAPKRPILNRVNNIIIPNNNISSFFIQIRLLLFILTFSTLEKLGMMMGTAPTFGQLLIYVRVYIKHVFLSFIFWLFHVRFLNICILCLVLH